MHWSFYVAVIGCTVAVVILCIRYILVRFQRLPRGRRTEKKLRARIRNLTDDRDGAVMAGQAMGARVTELERALASILRLSGHEKNVVTMRRITREVLRGVGDGED